MAHEVRHLYYAYPTGTMLGMFGNGLFSVLVLVFKLLNWLLKYIPNYTEDNEDVERKSGFIVRTFTNMFSFFTFVVNGITALVNSAHSRRNERYADYYAAHIGYGNQLLSALYALDDIMPEGFINVKQHVTRTHPYLYDRIAMLENER